MTRTRGRPAGGTSRASTPPDLGRGSTADHTDEAAVRPIIQQLAFGADVTPHAAARRTDPDTSVSAAQRVQRSPGRLRRLVLTAHQLHADGGLTDDELARLFPAENPPSLGRRRTELAAEGIVADSGERRRTRRGSPAVVWRLVGDR